VRFLLLIHRYLGIAIGLVMALWCASGFVMMYVGYPSLDAEQRARVLEPLVLSNVALDKVSESLGVDAFDSFNVEMVAGRPILRARSVGRNAIVIDLWTGEPLRQVTQSQAESVAAQFGDAAPLYRGFIERDQWTVSGQFNRDRPLHHIALDDSRGTEVYVSSTTGMAVQATTRNVRFWNWLGAVPHWLYPTVLRQHVEAWSQVVIWLSLAGVFLTLIGLYIGIDHWRAMKGTKLSPYRGLPLWHHLSGLFFGVLTLTWVGSGLVSMSPWGLFESTGFSEERERVRDMWIDGGQIATALRSFASQPTASRIESAPLGGKLYLLIHQKDRVVRVDANTFMESPLDAAQMALAVKRLAGSPDAALDLLQEGDTYYYSGHEPRTFPVYRVSLKDDDRTRYYFDAKSGDLIDKIDPPRRSYRWLFEGLHRLDFTTAFRSRPWWDLIVLPLMIGVTSVCFTGVWMGWKRLRSK
jgi:hypothetical protein